MSHATHSYTAAHASDDLWAIDRELHGWHQQAARDAWVRVHNFIVAQLNAAPQGQVVEGAASPAQPAVAAPSMPPLGPSDEVILDAIVSSAMERGWSPSGSWAVAQGAIKRLAATTGGNK